MSKRVNGLLNNCPECGVSPGQACIGTAGQPRASVHRARLKKSPAYTARPQTEDILQRAVRLAADEYKADLESYIIEPYHKVESPIEHAMLIAFAHHDCGFRRDLELGCGKWEFCRTIEHGGPYDLDTRGTVYSQAEVGPYRTDFLVVMRHEMAGHKLDRLIAVECDGHNFHHKTKGQIERDKARDRYFASKNILVMRFAGSEIYRNPLSCVDQVASACGSIFDDWHTGVADHEFERWKAQQEKGA